MRQDINKELTQGSYRIICTKCHHVFTEENGGITEWAIAASKQSKTCIFCGGEVILEANPEDKPNKYDVDHPYPNFWLSMALNMDI